MSCSRCERGGAPTLAVFAVFVVVCSAVAVAHFRTSAYRSANAIQQRMAADVTRAMAASIETELNWTLEKAIWSAMYTIGLRGGTVEEVENAVREHLNGRIRRGWEGEHPSISVYVPEVNEDTLLFVWRPDGGIEAIGLIPAKIEHVEGPAAYGISLRTAPSPRFERIKHVTEQIFDVLKTTPVENIEVLECELNENYACEGLGIELTLDNGMVMVSVSDIFSGRGVLVGS